jgi:thioredoxin-related protein
MGPGLRRLISLVILACLTIGSALAAGVPPAADLAADARLMREKRLPMLVFFSRNGCPWCEQARREYIGPLAADPATGALVRQVDVDRDTPLQDFAGRPTSHRAFAREHQVRLAPTLMFFGPDGEMVAETIVGFRLADFYGAYIDEALAVSRGRLGGGEPAPPPR